MPKQMYPAMVNSPQTELAADITATDTTITVLDASVLPYAHNLIVIGSDENAETILYRGKSGNDLTGCIRGFQGAAREWPAGSKCARNYTAYDHDAARENIEENRAGVQAAQQTADSASTAITNHTNATNVHGATPAATPNRIAMRDAAGRMKAAAPAAVDDVARKAEVDAAESNAKNASLSRSGGKVTGLVDFETTLDGGNKSVVHFTATDGKRYSISLRTDGTISLWNATDGVTVARFSSDGEALYVGSNKPVWHSDNFNPASKADQTALNSHVANKSNPHGVTAAQVGALPNGGGKVTGPVDFETTLNGGNKSVAHFTATDGKRYSISMRTDGTMSIWNATDEITVARFGPDTRMYVGFNEVWHDGSNPVSKAVNGYQKLANGLIIQWGTIANTNPNTEYTATFPVAFPSACRSVTATFESTNNSANTPVLAYSRSATSCKFRHFFEGDSVTRIINWMAIGY